MSRAGRPLDVHASAVAVEGRGLLILGASGAGKSGLALRMMAYGARLVADDRVLLYAGEGTLVASAPEALRGLVEARGVGLLRADALAAVELTLAVDLDRAAAARMPQARKIAYLGIEIDLILGRGAPNLPEALLQLLRCGESSSSG